MKNSLSVVAGSSHVEAARLLLANGAKMMVNANGSSVVHEAIIWRQPEMLKFLLSELKVGVDLKSANGRTPLHYAISRMEKGQNIRNQLDIASVKILLQHGADPNQQFTDNNVKRSAIGLAEFKGLDEVVALLKSRGDLDADSLNDLSSDYRWGCPARGASQVTSSEIGRCGVARLL